VEQQDHVSVIAVVAVVAVVAVDKFSVTSIVVLSPFAIMQVTPVQMSLILRNTFPMWPTNSGNLARKNNVKAPWRFQTSYDENGLLGPK
jgi:hypothetical protein